MYCAWHQRRCDQDRHCATHSTGELRRIDQAAHSLLQDRWAEEARSGTTQRPCARRAARQRVEDAPERRNGTGARRRCAQLRHDLRRAGLERGAVLGLVLRALAAPRGACLAAARQGVCEDVAVPLAAPAAHRLDEHDEHKDADARACELCLGRDLPRRREEARADRLPVAAARRMSMCAACGGAASHRTHSMCIEHAVMASLSMSIPMPMSSSWRACSMVTDVQRW